MHDAETTPRPETSESSTADPGLSRAPLGAEGALEVGLAAGGWLRYGVADLGEVVEEARACHDLGPIAAAALGRSFAAAALLLRMSTKVPSRLVFELRGDGPLRSVLVETDDEGHLRGTVGEPRVDLPSRPDTKLPVSEALGAGTLRVIRERPGGGAYASQVKLVSGEIGVDVAHFLAQSEQRRSAVLLGALHRPTGVASAGGAIVELLPGAPDEVVSALEANLARAGGVSRLFEEGGTPRVLDTVFDGMDREVVERSPLLHRCRCDGDRLRAHLAMLPEEDLDGLRTDDGEIEGLCVFCGTRYAFDPAGL
jgi:molecular chaperone Hsp33